jgi:hypothetical protein
MPTMAAHLAVQITVAEPTVVRALAVFPLIADRSPSVRYVSLAEPRLERAARRVTEPETTSHFAHRSIDFKLSAK